MRRFSPEGSAGRGDRRQQLVAEEEGRRRTKQEIPGPPTPEQEAERERERAALMRRWNRELGVSIYHALAYDGTKTSLDRLAIAEESQLKDARNVFPKNQTLARNYELQRAYNDVAGENSPEVERRLVGLAGAHRRAYGDTKQWAAKNAEEQRNGALAHIPEEHMAERTRGFALAALERNDVDAFFACVSSSGLANDDELSVLFDQKVDALDRSSDPRDRATADDLRRRMESIRERRAA